MTYKLMIVDDEPANLRLLERLFRQDFYCLTASSAAEAIQLLHQHDVAILITDQRMPQMTGIELLKHTAELRPHMVRILLTGYTDIEALVEAINCGLVYMYVTKPWSNEDLRLRVNRALQHYENNRSRHSLTLANHRLASRLEELKAGFVSALGAALSAKDGYAFDHASRVAKYAALIGNSLKLTDEDRKELSAAALLHNIGHIGTPDRILQKEGQLTSDEVAIFRAHSERGAQILAAIAELHDVADIVRFQLENFNGTGYPRGLRGEEIPLFCRIVRVADEYDSLTQPRDPSATVSHDAALDNLVSRTGKDLDPLVVQLLVELGQDALDETPLSPPNSLAPNLQPAGVH